MFHPKSKKFYLDNIRDCDCGSDRVVMLRSNVKGMSSWFCLSCKKMWEQEGMLSI